MSSNRSSSVRPHRLALAIAALLPLGAVYAQDTATPAAPASSEATTLDAVQVTAQRRVENIKDVPVSISTISSEKLDVLASQYSDGHTYHMDGFSAEFPDWHFNVRPSNTEPLLRLNLEALTPELMARKRDEVLALIRS